MDDEPGWTIAHYSIFEDGHTGEVYDTQKALVERPATWTTHVKGKKSITVEGTDFKEVPHHYLTPDYPWDFK